MTTDKASDLLAERYAEFGVTKRKAVSLILKGTERGMSVKQSYNFARYFLSKEFDTFEKFSIDDIVCMTGLSRAKVLEKFSDSIDEMSEDEIDRYFDTNTL
jgi:hypothetical protein